MRLRAEMSEVVGLSIPNPVPNELKGESLLYSSLLAVPHAAKGILNNALRCFLTLPTFTQELPEFEPPTTIHCSATSKHCFEALGQHTIEKLFSFADPCGPFTIEITCPDRCTLNASAHQLLITASLDGVIDPLVSLRASTAFRCVSFGRGFTVSIGPGWWSGATSFTIVGIYLAGQAVGTPPLPTTVKVTMVNHTPSIEGPLMIASCVNDAPGVISAIIAGCSTEEISNEDVSLWQGITLPMCAFFRFIVRPPVLLQHRTALSVASQCGFEVIVSILIDAGACIDAASKVRSSDANGIASAELYPHGNFLLLAAESGHTDTGWSHFTVACC